MMRGEMPQTITDDAFKSAMASFASGVTVVTTVDGRGELFGLTATAFCSVSKSPPLCLVCVAKSADPYPALKETGRFVVNVLSEQQGELSVRFATHGIDKFAGVGWSAGPETGCAILSGSLISIECTVETIVEAGDHEVFIGRMQGIHQGTGLDPLLYYRGRYAEIANP
jgi:flavin reductase (DIM6/NTAB) family NADH-FMN oxidoreductase RutF